MSDASCARVDQRQLFSNSLQLNVELLVVYLAIKHFRHYVEGRAFAVYIICFS